MPRRMGWQGAWHLSRALWVNYCLPIGLLPFAFNHVEVASLWWNGRPVLAISPACHRVLDPSDVPLLLACRNKVGYNFLAQHPSNIL